MSSIYLFPVSGVITAICAFFVWESVWRAPRVSAKAVAILLTVSMALTLYALLRLEPVTEWGLEFKLPAAVAISVMIVQYIYSLGLMHHGIQGLGLFLLPATAIPLLIIPLLPQTPYVWVHTTTFLETSHLLISLLAYAILTLAALHAIMHLMLDHALKRKQIGRITQSLPSLIEIEAHMYAQIRSATWLLALGIISGLTWQWEGMGHFALVSHKVILALFSWFVLLSLLVMRKRAGWQGRRASIMVLIAYVLLLLAYFGVRLVESWML